MTANVNRYRNTRMSLLTLGQWPHSRASRRHAADREAPVDLKTARRTFHPLDEPAAYPYRLRAALLVMVAWVSVALALPAAAQPPVVPIKGPLVVSANPNYFKDANGTVIILNGSQTWNTFQDWGSNGSFQELNFDAFVKFLVAHGHNFTLLWITELPKFCGFPSTASSPPDLTVGPFPWRRSGPGQATDGGPKFDLTKFDQSFFDRLRKRVQALRKAGIYVGVYPFTGEWRSTSSAAPATVILSLEPTMSTALTTATARGKRGSTL